MSCKTVQISPTRVICVTTSRLFVRAYCALILRFCSSPCVFKYQNHCRRKVCTHNLSRVRVRGTILLDRPHIIAQRVHLVGIQVERTLLSAITRALLLWRLASICLALASFSPRLLGHSFFFLQLVLFSSACILFGCLPYIQPLREFYKFPKGST
jgi:hypothetical protein